MTPCGYATAKEQIFEIREKNIVLKVVDEDIKVDISKKDITNKKELSGAHLQVKMKMEKFLILGFQLIKNTAFVIWKLVKNIF